MTKFAVLVEYDLPDDGTITFDIAARPLIDALREPHPSAADQRHRVRATRRRATHRIRPHSLNPPPQRKAG